MARRAAAFGLQIHYHNRKRVSPRIEEELQATYWESLDQMLARMDVISVNCPHTPATYHLLSARRIKLIKPGAILVNTRSGIRTPKDLEGRRVGVNRGYTVTTGVATTSTTSTSTKPGAGTAIMHRYHRKHSLRNP